MSDAAAPSPAEPLRQRSLGAGDLQACLQLDRLALDQLWTEEQWRRELEEERRPGVGLWSDGRLLAMASGWLVLEELHITLVAVDPGQRRRGLGRRVLQALLQIGRRGGAERATLEVAMGNSAARALYDSCGFRSVGIRRGYYRSGEDALIQWVELC